MSRFALLPPLLSMLIACRTVERDADERHSPSPRPALAVSALPAPPDLTAPPADALRSPSGLATRVLAPGSGAVHPRATDHVRIHFTGWRSANGEMFESTVVRRRPEVIGLERALPAFTEALQLMVAGEKRRLWVPAYLAYGEKPTGPYPPGALVYDLELLDVMKTR